MTAKEIFEEYILADKPVTLQFESISDCQRLVSIINVYKSRHRQLLNKLQMQEIDLIGDRVIKQEVLSKTDNEVTVKIYLAEKTAKPALQFKIIE